ncbi:hypothetical protein GCM10027445_03020 [Amycolatopsis endophytica]|uniref:Ubiquinone/menaquinone biosynthesis C-methylase UbiE n=1 Tax=Amycolatopsis endophytica TaxID=860233 RepID=A0A853B8M0_9PSEU|nr:class I SAM-dependent methyltransferase [Amycolatopsis endophytica]NYI91360.1 ubiquinone/menaquinone biosynthesis C-methylase UbiE [Amycolatopsis endophytica]
MTPEEVSRSTAEVFDAAAEAFTRWTPLLWGPVGEAVAGLAALRPGERVVDACCGNGAASIPAARHVAPHGVVDAVDLAGELLTAGRARASASDVTGVRFHLADVTTWQAPPGGYDAALCSFGVFFFPDMDAGGRHLLNLLRPDGRMVVTTWQHGAVEPIVMPFVRAAAAERDAAGLAPVQTARMREASARVEHRDGLATWLRAIGGTGAEVSTVVPEVPLDAGRAWDFVIGSGTRTMLLGLDEPAVTRVRHRFETALRADGVTSFRPTVLVGRAVRPS